jgi:hypothetical protein
MRNAVKAGAEEVVGEGDRFPAAEVGAEAKDAPAPAGVCREVAGKEGIFLKVEVPPRAARFPGPNGRERSSAATRQYNGALPASDQQRLVFPANAAAVFNSDRFTEGRTPEARINRTTSLAVCEIRDNLTATGRSRTSASGGATTYETAIWTGTATCAVTYVMDAKLTTRFEIAIGGIESWMTIEISIGTEDSTTGLTRNEAAVAIATGLMTVEIASTGEIDSTTGEIDSRDGATNGAARQIEFGRIGVTGIGATFRSATAGGITMPASDGQSTAHGGIPGGTIDRISGGAILRRPA